MPSFFSVGPDGNVSSIQSSDYVANAVDTPGVGFKLFDSSVVHPFLQRGGVDAGDIAVGELYVITDAHIQHTRTEYLSVNNNPADGVGEISIERTTGTVGTGVTDMEFWLLLPSNRVPPVGFTEAWTVAGGPCLYAEELATTALYAGAAYAELAPFVRVSVPHAGIYDVYHEAYCIGGAAAAFSIQSFSGPGIAASDTNALAPTLVANGRLNQSRVRTGLSLSAGTYKLENRSPSAVGIQWGSRTLKLIPRTLFF